MQRRHSTGARLVLFAFMLAVGTSCGGASPKPAPKEESPKLPWTSGSEDQDHGVDPAAVRAMSGGDRHYFVTFERGTAVVFDADEPPSSLEAAALKVMRTAGPVIPGTPSAEFETVKLSAGHGWVVKSHHPNLMTFIRANEVLPDADDRSLGLFARDKRKRDVADLKIVHVEQGGGSREPMPQALQRSALEAIDVSDMAPCEGNGISNGTLHACILVVGGLAGDLLEHLSKDATSGQSELASVHYLTLRVPPISELKPQFHLYVFDDGASVHDVLDEQALGRVRLLLIAEENGFSANTLELASLVKGGQVEAKSVLLAGKSSAPQWLEAAGQEPIYVEDYAHEELSFAFKKALTELLPNQ